MVQAHNLLDLHNLAKAFKDNISFTQLIHPPILSIRNAPRWALETALEQTHDVPDLQTFIKMSLDTGQTHDMVSLEKHTQYLNGHRTHFFNTKTWQVQLSG